MNLPTSPLSFPYLIPKGKLIFHTPTSIQVPSFNLDWFPASYQIIIQEHIHLRLLILKSLFSPTPNESLLYTLPSFPYYFVSQIHFLCSTTIKNSLPLFHPPFDSMCSLNLSYHFLLISPLPILHKLNIAPKGNS